MYVQLVNAMKTVGYFDVTVVDYKFRYTYKISKVMYIASILTHYSGNSPSWIRLRCVCGGE